MSDPDIINGDRIKVTWLELNDNGGTEIQSYSLEIDDGLGGNFTAVIGLYENNFRFQYTIEDGIERATNHRQLSSQESDWLR